LPILELLVWVLCVVVLALVIHHVRRTRAHSAQLAGAAAQDLFETAPIGYVEIDRDGTVVRANQQFAKLLGRAKPEFIGRHCQEWAPAAQRQQYTEQIARKMSGEAKLAPYQLEYERPDGSSVVLEIHEELLTGSSGQAAGMRMAAVDVTQRKKSDEQAYQITSELHALFQAFPDFFLRLDRDGKIHDARGGEKSDPFLAPEKFLGRNLEQVLPREAFQEFTRAREQAKRTKSLGIGEFSVELQPEPQTYELRLLELGWGWIVIVRNITGRKTDETRLRDYAQELERKNEEMETALATAREATQLKGRFLATVSHEIRTPLNGVLGMTDLLLGTDLKGEQLEYAESIKRSATSLLGLINDILDLSRIEAGKLKLRQVPFSLKTVVEETASLFALQARGKGLEFRLDIAPNVPAMVAGDPERLGQVLNNLLGNAIKFTESGRIGLTVILIGESAAGSQVRFTVEDTGIGIGPEDQDRIFERFTQADTSNTRKYGGTGLGLAISKELVELLGGEISVESELGRGSKFWFTAALAKTSPREASPASKAANPVKTPSVQAGSHIKVTIPSPAAQSPAGTPVKVMLPAAPSAAGSPVRVAVPAAQSATGALGRTALPDPPVASGLPAGAMVANLQSTAGSPAKPGAPAQQSGPKRDGLANLTAALRGQGARVLLAEDNEINQRITVRLLEKMGLAVDAVANGRLAVDAVSKKNYGLILMDCQMPEMDGFEATAVIRNRERNERHTPICALTANAMEGDRERCLAAGMDDYIAKPVSVEKLESAIDRWVRRAGNPAGQPASPAVQS
jgi:two-component system sensor histidine kinase/response regulator